MKKINNKGLSIIELLICFVIVAFISITLLNIILEYKGIQETENIKNIIRTYKDEVTHVIQKDIISKTLSNAEEVESDGNHITIKLTFKNNFDDENNEKTLVINFDDTENGNYIQYPDIVKTEYGDGIQYDRQDIRYYLPHTTRIHLLNDENLNESSETTKNDIYFQIPRHLDCDGFDSFICNGIFRLYIPIEHSEIDGTYAIDIIAPVTQ